MSAFDRMAGNLTGHGQAAAMPRGAGTIPPDRLRNGLILSLDQPADGIADFMFTARPSSRRDIDIWHPLPEVEQSLDLPRLTHTLHALSGGGSGAAASLRLALLGEIAITNLELPWHDSGGAQRCWLVSTRQEAGAVTGLVRDVSLARNLADTVALGLLLSPEQHARGRLATAGVAAAIRQQAHVISSICELLCDTTGPGGGSQDCSRGVLTSDMRDAISELIVAADLLRDYSDAEHGCLRLEPQRWPVADIIARALPGMKRLLERHGVSLSCRAMPQGTKLNADLPRAATLLQLAVCAALPAMTPGCAAELLCTLPSAGGVAFTWKYEGAPFDQNRLNQDSIAGPCPASGRISRLDLMHPAISSGLMTALLQAHGGSLRSAPDGGTAQTVTLHLHDVGAE
jgi:hypothetical protein